MKLIKKRAEGGFLDTLDSELNKLGLGKIGVQMMDPTGITGYKDLGVSWDEFKNDKSLKNLGSLALSTLGAMPMIGLVGRSSKLISKSKKLFDKDTYKLLVDSSEPAAQWMARNFTTQQKEEAVRILDKEIDKIVDWCKDKNITKVPKKLEDKIANYADKQAVILGKDTNIPQLMNAINYELKLA